MSQEPIITPPSPHPPSCRACDGTGWVDGPPRYQTVDGQPHPYTTVIRCTWHWWHDEPELDLEAHR